MTIERSSSIRVAGGVLLAGLVGVAWLFFTRGGCDVQRGEWVLHYCRSRLCVPLGNCAPFYGNTARCRRIPSNSAVEEVVFRLGQPRRDGNRYYFVSSPTGRLPIEAVVENGIVTALNCHPDRPPGGDGLAEKRLW